MVDDYSFDEDVEDVTEVEVVYEAPVADQSDEQGGQFEEIEVEVSVDTAPESTPDGQAQCQTEEDVRRAAHNERVAHISARFADLVAKGQEALDRLSERADAAEASFAKASKMADARVAGFADAADTKVETALDQFAKDIDTIARAADGILAEKDTDGSE